MINQHLHFSTYNLRLSNLCSFHVIIHFHFPSNIMIDKYFVFNVVRDVYNDTTSFMKSCRVFTRQFFPKLVRIFKYSHDSNTSN